MSETSPFTLALIDALKDPDTRQVLKEIQIEAHREINGPNDRPDEDLCLMPGAIELTGLARQSIYQKCHNKTIPHYKRGGKLYFSKSELRDWIKSGENNE